MMGQSKTCVLVNVAIPAQNIMTKKQIGEERVYSAYISTFLFITKGSQDWNSSRSGSRIWCRGHGGMFFTGLLPLPCSACSLKEPQDYQPRDGPTHKGLVVLGSIREQAEQARGSKPVSNIPPWPLNQLLLPDLLEFQSWLPWWWTAMWKCKLNKPFPPQLASWSWCLCRNRNPD